MLQNPEATKSHAAFPISSSAASLRRREKLTLLSLLSPISPLGSSASLLKLEKLQAPLVRKQPPLIYHLDVAALYPDIILANSLQMCTHIVERRRKIASLESDFSTLAQLP